MTTPNTEKPLTIVRLTASNVMRLKAGIEIVPKDNAVVISGENGHGKSSVLNCIAMALGGKKNMPKKPVRDGAAAADVHIDLGELVIDWRCTAGGSMSLTVRPKDGPGVKSPQTVLDSLWNMMCDPVKFVRMSETPEGCRKQAEILRQIVNLDFSALDHERQELYVEREELGRDLKNQKGQLTGLVFHADAPTEEISISEQMQKIQDANAINDTIRKEQSQLDSYNNQIAECAEKLEFRESEIERLQAEIENNRKTKVLIAKNRDELVATRDHQQSIVSTSQVQDTSVLEQSIKDAETTNKKVRDNASRRDTEEKVRKTQERYDVLTNQITEIDDEKKDKLAKTPFPVKGLGFDADGITLAGQPFAQGSQAEQLIAATAIALALKPRIRVVLLREASLIDAKTRKFLALLAEAEGAQIWEEVVESEDPSAIVIEEGEVKKTE